MVTEMEQYYSNCSQAIGYWADRNVERCGCGGRGWFLSELDTLHQCPFHFDGQPTNEDSDEVWDAYYRGKARAKYKTIARATCRRFGLTPSQFNHLAKEALEDHKANPRRTELSLDEWSLWVVAARTVLKDHEEVRASR